MAFLRSTYATAGSEEILPCVPTLFQYGELCSFYLFTPVPFDLSTFCFQCRLIAGKFSGAEKTPSLNRCYYIHEQTAPFLLCFISEIGSVFLSFHNTVYLG